MQKINKNRIKSLYWNKNYTREICGVDERRLRVYLYAYEYQDIRKMLYGLVHIRYNDKKLLSVIRNWINAYIEECGEVPEWPNGPDCDKRSVSKKFEMEKRVNSGEPLVEKH